MNISQLAKSARDKIQLGVYKVIDPAVKLMVRLGITPNVITTVGFVGNLLATALFVYAAIWMPDDDYSMVGLAGWVIILASLFDMVDGYLARTSGQCTTFGAFYDSVLDRYCELFTLGGIAFYFMAHTFYMPALITLFSLIGSIMVSYVRARAEGLGVECKVGLMQRPERVVLTSLGAILCGLLADSVEEYFCPLWLLLAPQILIAILANWTACVRILHVYKKIGKEEETGR